MKPFDFQTALHGAPVVTKLGLEVANILCYPDNPPGKFLLVTLETNEQHWYDRTGLHHLDSDLNLYMAPE